MPKVVKVTASWEGNVVAKDPEDAQEKVKRHIVRHPEVLKCHTKELGDVHDVDAPELKT